MFSAAQNARVLDKKKLDGVDIGIISPGVLPEKYTLSQLHDNLCATRTSNEEVVVRNTLILKTSLEHADRLSREAGDDSTITQISTWLSRAILPTKTLIPPSGRPIPDQALNLARQKGIVGLLIFRDSLLPIYSTPPKSPKPQIFLSLLAFTSSHDPWTTATSRFIAGDILSKYEEQTHTPAFIIDYLLQRIIRSRFSKSKHPEAITSSGRKAMPSSAPPRRFDASDQDPINLPWMYEAPYTITVFEWVVANSTAEIATPSFNLYLPPLLTLLDSTHTPTRCRGLSILTNFLPLLSEKFLIQSGLAEVFEDAITPTLSFLPNITPIDESVPLLEGAYKALFELGIILYGERNRERRRPLKLEESEMKFWDRLMRKGILMGYAHSSEHPAIAEVLLRNMGTLIGKMDVNCVKHLKDILPIITNTMTDPFAPSHLSLLYQAISVLSTTLSYAWPRLCEPPHRIAIMTALAVSWRNFQNMEMSDEDMEGIKAQLCCTGKNLIIINEGQGDVRADLDKLYEADEGLKELFGAQS